MRMSPTGGFLVRACSGVPSVATGPDAGGAPSSGALAGWLRQVCAPLLVMAEWPADAYAPRSRLSLQVHVVNETADGLEGAVVTASAIWPGGGREVRFTGGVRPSGVTYVGRLQVTLPSGPGHGGGPWPLGIDLELRTATGRSLSANRYRSHIATTLPGQNW